MSRSSALSRSPIDFVFVHDDVGFFIEDNGMLNDSKLNVVASLTAGRALYGNCVATSGHTRPSR